MLEGMRPNQLSSLSPGRLVPATFEAKSPGGGAAPQSGWAFVPNPLPPAELEARRDEVIGRQWSLLDRAKTNLIRLESEAGSLPDPNVVLGAMRAREAQASSRIENTVASLADVAAAALRPSGTPSQASEVHRNRLAIEHGLNSPLPISERLVREMHGVLITDPRQRPAQFRDRQVHIGDAVRGFAGARFVPPPAGEVAGAMRDWELYVNPDALDAPQRSRWPDLIELAMAHYQFETIHPFSDGNGRLGRALVNLGPIKAGWLQRPVCNLSEWLQSHRQEYYDRLLAVSTHGAWEAWIEYFLRAVGEQALSDLQRVARIRALRSEYLSALATKRGSALAGKLIDHLFTQPAVTVLTAKRIMDLSYPGAKKHVDALVKRGVLVEATPGNYGKIYVAPGIIQAIHGPEGD